MLCRHLESLKDSVLSQEDKPKQEELFFSRVLNNQDPQSTMSMLLNLQKTNEFLQHQSKSTKLQNKKLNQELKQKEVECAKLNGAIMKIRNELQDQKEKFFRLIPEDNLKITEQMFAIEQQLRDKIINLQLQIERCVQDKQMLKEVYMEARNNMIQQVSLLRIESSSKDRIIEQIKAQLKQKDTQVSKKQEQIQCLKKKIQGQNIQINSRITIIGPSSSCIENSKNQICCSRITSASDQNTSKRKLSFDIQGNNLQSQEIEELEKIEEQSNSSFSISKFIDGFSYSKDYYKLALAEQKFKSAKLQRQYKLLIEKYEQQQMRNKQLEKGVKKYQEHIHLLAGKQQSYDILFSKQQKKIENMIKMYDNELQNFKKIQNQQLSKKWLDQYHSLQQSIKNKDTEMKNMEKKYLEQICHLKRKIRQLERQQKLIIRQSPKNIGKVNIPDHIEKKLQKEGQKNDVQNKINVKTTHQYILLQKQLTRYKNLLKNEKLNHQKAKNYHEALLKMLEKAKKFGRKDSNEIVDDAINWVKRTSSHLSGDSQTSNVLLSRENLVTKENTENDSAQTINPESPILLLQSLKERNSFQNKVSITNSKKN